jgi:hypothetical protein
MTRKYSPNHPAVRYRMAHTPLPDTADIRTRTAAVRARRGMRPARERRGLKLGAGFTLIITSALLAHAPVLWITTLAVGVGLVLSVIERVRKEQGY